ncbi:acyl-CoA dehydrogenase family protein [Roseococcus sp. SDR]|uniref:acyl-CoA dehydrogenase family protein n=1 Tax=Roseococcus sp. SDR TaxID=2835532 RepID=UPI001BCE7EA1|nr:acyl-CoA dehydrogenase family protein [Roseococcus sp. SDR]MBS7789805.1 acyl-CoA dehydrogenase family protein [Roseococcus sp. SDR]MBV1845119.1 acyl-CoA dehydrogenase family protein [Roseococcus sp. SDR]
MDTNAARPSRPRTVFTPEHEMFREQFRRFVEREIAPHHRDWERAGIVPREVWQKAGAQGFLCTMLDPEYGGAGGDFGHAAIIIEELARVNASGVAFQLHSDIVVPYIGSYASEARKREWLPRMAAGEIIGAIAMTEPGMGSDLKAVRTRAVRDGDHWVINGAKTFISSGQNAGLVIVVCKTDPEAGRRGVSLIAVEEGTPGFTKGRKLEKIGMHAQDTSELFFEDVRVPVGNLIGEENGGFRHLMHQLPQERLVIAVRAATSMETMLEKTIAYTKERQVFGHSVFDFQVHRFKLAQAKAEIAMFRVYVDDCIARHMKGELSGEEAAAAKLLGTEMQNRLLDDFLQMHGGYGYMAEYEIGRAWADARVGRIYGGSSEVMREIIARTL